MKNLMQRVRSYLKNENEKNKEMDFCGFNFNCQLCKKECFGLKYIGHHKEHGYFQGGCFDCAQRSLQDESI